MDRPRSIALAIIAFALVGLAGPAFVGLLAPSSARADVGPLCPGVVAGEPLTTSRADTQPVGDPNPALYVLECDWGPADDYVSITVQWGVRDIPLALVGCNSKANAFTDSLEQVLSPKSEVLGRASFSPVNRAEADRALRSMMAAAEPLALPCPASGDGPGGPDQTVPPGSGSGDGDATDFDFSPIVFFILILLALVTAWLANRARHRRPKSDGGDCAELVARYRVQVDARHHLAAVVRDGLMGLSVFPAAKPGERDERGEYLAKLRERRRELSRLDDEIGATIARIKACPDDPGALPEDPRGPIPDVPDR